MRQQIRNTGVSILNGILSEVKLNDEVTKENKKVLRVFLNSFVEEMEEVDEVFRSLYREPYHTGSYYSNLRISEPDEFDINLIIDMPFKDHEFTIIHELKKPNFVKYHSYIPATNSGAGNQHGAYVFDNDFLMPALVRSWFQSIIDRALETYEMPTIINDVYVRQAGPAETITIVKNNGKMIYVDLVPVIGCTLNMSAEMRLNRRVEAKVGRNLEAFLVPKPPHPLTDINMTEAGRLWRCHFPKAEEDIIYKKGCAKSIIKLLKLLRDEEQWSILASYYLKTVVMWMIVENSHILNFWREDKMFKRFFQALNKLAGYVERRYIPYIFNTNCNLIEKMSHQEASNINNRLNIFIRNIKRDVNYLSTIF